MNAKKLIAAVAVFAAAGAAFAEPANTYTGFAGPNDQYVAPAAGFVSNKTRAQIMAELKQSQVDGSYAALHQEYEGQSPAPDAAPSRLAGKGKTDNLN